MQRRRLNPFVQRWIWTKRDSIVPVPSLAEASAAARAIFCIDQGVDEIPEGRVFRACLRRYKREFRWTDAGYILAPLDRRAEKRKAIQRPTYSRDRRRNRPSGNAVPKEAMAAADMIVRRAVEEHTKPGEIIATSKHRSYLIEKAKKRLELPLSGTFPNGCNVGRAILRCPLLHPPQDGKHAWILRRLLPGEIRLDIEDRAIRKALRAALLRA